MLLALVSSKVKAVRDANVTLGSTAALNCTAEGNPAVAVRNFAWRRLIYPNWGTEAQEAPQIGTTSVSCDEASSVLRFLIWSPQPPLVPLIFQDLYFKSDFDTSFSIKQQLNEVLCFQI